MCQYGFGKHSKNFLKDFLDQIANVCSTSLHISVALKYLYSIIESFHYNSTNGEHHYLFNSFHFFDILQYFAYICHISWNFFLISFRFRDIAV